MVARSDGNHKMKHMTIIINNQYPNDTGLEMMEKECPNEIRSIIIIFKCVFLSVLRKIHNTTNLVYFNYEYSSMNC